MLSPHQPLLSPKTQIIQTRLAAFAWIRAQRCAFAGVVVPDKQAFYPEYVPGWVRRAPGLSPLDQLLAAQKTKPGEAILDLRPALLAGKAERPVYWRGDTHWNSYGAYLAYAEIMAALRAQAPPAWQQQPGLQTHPLNDYELRPVSYTGDLDRLLGLDWQPDPAGLQHRRALPPSQIVSNGKSESKPDHDPKRLAAAAPVVIQTHSVGHWFPTWRNTSAAAPLSTRLTTPMFSN
jgi:hypothetical protein